MGLINTQSARHSHDGLHITHARRHALDVNIVQEFTDTNTYAKFKHTDTHKHEKPNASMHAWELETDLRVAHARFSHVQDCGA